MATPIPITPSLRASIEAEILECLRELVLAPEFTARVTSVDWVDVVAEHRLRHEWVLHISLSTNLRALLLGAVGSSGKSPARRGYHNNLIGERVGRLLRQAQAVGNQYQPIVQLDVGPVRMVPDNPFVVIAREEAVRRGLIDEGSVLDAYMRRYSLQDVLLAGDEIAGPSAAMLRAAERVHSWGVSDRWLDLFAGTGAIGRVARMLGSNKVESIDMRSLSTEGVERVKVADVWNVDFQDDYDVVSLDPFFDDACEVAAQLLPRLIGRTKRFIFHVGYEFDRKWVRHVGRVLSQQVRMVQFERAFGSVVAYGHCE